MAPLRLLLLALAIFALPAVSSEDLPKPERTPKPPTKEQTALIAEGVALHDQKDFKAAIAKYKEVLLENPSAVTALHELALSYFENKQYEDALATARLGTQFQSRALPFFYILMGNALDELGRGKESVEVYRSAVELNPRIGLLHYNLALSLRRGGNNAEARPAVEKALLCSPMHSSSHAMLATIYREMGYHIPAILAYSRFLQLEPESPRAAQALPQLLALLSSGVAKGKEKGNVNVTIPMAGAALLDEGDFGPSEMALSIAVAAEFMMSPAKTKPQTSPFEKLVSIYASVGASLGNSKPKSGFAATFYSPYFAELVKTGHTGAFVARAWKGAKVTGAAEWEAANAPKLEAFDSWSRTYEWPR